MPYIKQKRRRELNEEVDNKFAKPYNSGELNYLITSVVDRYMMDRGESYAAYNDVIGALEGAKLEIYRRKISIYENKKIHDNGDVYGEHND